MSTTPPPAPEPQPQNEPVLQPRQYEFTPQDDALFDDLASKMNFVGYVMLFVALFGLGLMIYRMVVTRFGVITFDLNDFLLLFIAGWTIYAAGEFRKVATTQGRDITHVLDALSALRSLYTLLFWVLLITIVLVLLLVVLVSVGLGG